MTPAGDEEIARVTVPVYPSFGCTWIVVGADCPRTNETLVGLADRVKSGFGVEAPRTT